MRFFRSAFFLTICFQLGALPTLADEAAIEQELDQYWSSVAHFLAVGDYEGLVTTYHPDAVLVSESLDTSYPIAKALVRWKPGILATKAGEAMSMVEFKVTERLFSETTSHEKGMFHFKTGPLGDDVSDADLQEAYVHFEALLLKDGAWKMVMEYQKQEASLAEWEAAR
ncbi:hypothetical protein NOR53_1561 [gamma proteobacterium NOR5-3]|nr:hypothetical protein NOR53_1561 [gamma proteobacterium NOR5-3]